MAQKFCKAPGIFFSIAGMVALLFGSRESFYHDLRHLVTRVATVYIGFKSKLTIAKNFCLGYGAFDFMVGISGFCVGQRMIDFPA